MISPLFPSKNKIVFCELPLCFFRILFAMSQLPFVSIVVMMLNLLFSDLYQNFCDSLQRHFLRALKLADRVLLACEAKPQINRAWAYTP